MKLDPLGGWAWSPAQWEYEMMIQGVYMTLGVMMIIASNDPVRHSMFVWFVVWSSIVHGGIMAYQAAIDSHEMGHFLAAILQGIYVDGFSIGFGPSFTFLSICFFPSLTTLEVSINGFSP